MREVDGEEYLTASEVEKRFGWGSSTLYYFRSIGKLKNYRFIREKKAYWKTSEVEALVNLPPEERTPKPEALATTKKHRASGETVIVGNGIPSITETGVILGIAPVPIQ